MDRQRKNESCYHCHEEGGQPQNTTAQQQPQERNTAQQQAQQAQQDKQARDQQWCHDDCNC